MKTNDTSYLKQFQALRFLYDVYRANGWRKGEVPFTDACGISG
jgi:hypothetical protein